MMWMAVIKNNDVKKKCEQKLNIDEQTQNILQVLQENNLPVPHVCNGNGTCGKCKIKLVSGNLPITEADRRLLSKKELEQGTRLACKANMKEIFEINANNELVLELIRNPEENIVAEAIEIELRDITDKSYFIAVDIGTTTIAMALVNAQTGEVCDTYTSLNHQRKYGADVLSRISAANSGKAEELKKIIEEDLQNGIKKLLSNEIREKDSITNEGDSKDKNIKNRKIELTKIIIAGNTTMIHLLMGYSCEFLGKYPFVSEHLKQIQCTLKECIGKFQNHELKINMIPDEEENKIYSKCENVPVTILPGISAFVGGDIVADVVACEGFETGGICLLIDLGTNGEIVLGNKHKILATSTAAGPAFEGGNITCGTASIPGSICQVKIQNQKAIVRTIKSEMPPNGICGTGLISVVAQLKKEGLVDEEGTLKQPYDKNGFPLWIFENGDKIALYQKDIREFQLAKAAIRAGIDLLLEEYGCISEEIKNVYIAGGFGKAINIEDVFMTKMFPEKFREKINFMGNSALQGAVCFGKDIMIRKQIENICDRTDNIILSENPEFQNKYMKYMNL